MLVQVSWMKSKQKFALWYVLLCTFSFLRSSQVVICLSLLQPWIKLSRASPWGLLLMAQWHECLVLIFFYMNFHSNRNLFWREACLNCLVNVTTDDVNSQWLPRAVSTFTTPVKMWTCTTYAKHFVLMELSCVTHRLSLSFFSISFPVLLLWWMIWRLWLPVKLG